MQKDNYIFRLDARYAKNNLISIIIIFLPCAALVFYAIATADDLVFEVKTLYFIVFGIAVFMFLLDAFAIFRIDKVFLTENSIVVQKNSKNLEFLYADIKFVIRKEWTIADKSSIKFYDRKTSEPIFVLGGHFISRSDFECFIEAISKHTILNSELVEQGTFGEALNLIDEDGSSQLQYPYLSKKNFFGD